MGTDAQAPDFDAWVEYCFTHAYSDFLGEGAEDGSEAREDRFLLLKPIEIVKYLCRLFDSCEMLVDRFTPDQIASGVWFIFGLGSFYFGDDVMDPSVPEELQIEAHEKITRMYTHCFDVLCNRRGTTSERLAAAEEIDGAVYMIWDMDQIQYQLYQPDENPRVTAAAYQTLETVLRECRTASCLHSALHGLGHAIAAHPEPGRSIVGRFINERGAAQPEWLRKYASSALEGMVQ